MFGIIVIVGVLVSAVLLALDTRRRTGRIAYWRVVIAVGVTFFGAGARAGQQLSSMTLFDAGDFLAGYAGMLAFLWFVIVRPKELADESFELGVSLLEKGDAQQALAAFNQALEKAKTNRGRGRILYNMAICNLRLGKKDTAIKEVAEAVSVLPSLRSRIEKDKDFSELHDDEEFRAVIE
jgi:tetratricopeptide (TPR) repeat protein